MTVQVNHHPPALERANGIAFRPGALLRRTVWEKKGFCNQSARSPFRLLVVGSRRNPGTPRAPIWRGRLLSGEALRVVQELKSAQARKDSSRLSQVIKSKLARLVKFDLLAVFNELRRQNECDLALLVFHVITKEFWYRPDDGLRSSLITTLAQNKRIEDIEQLYVSTSMEGGQESSSVHADVLSVQVIPGSLQKAITFSDEQGKVGHTPCNANLRKGIEPNGDNKLVATLEQESTDVDAEREEQVDEPIKS